jgi:hypothetical protein
MHVSVIEHSILVIEWAEPTVGKVELPLYLLATNREKARR